jgi:antitoxin ParD1/3/4
MNVVLKPEFEKFVEDQIKSGRYASAGDLIQSAISRLQTSDELSDVDDLRQEAAIGLREADRGEFVEFSAETVIAEGRKILAARRSSPK